MDPKREPPSSVSYKAAHAVLNIHELLHGILVRLPLKDLVVATGVCQTWRKLKDNLAIQKAMFLSPVDISDIMANTDLCLSMRLEDVPRSQYSIVGEAHDALADFSSSDLQGVSDTGQYHQSLRQVFRAKSLFQHPLGCWREMFTSQPPTTSVSIVLSPFFDSRHKGKSKKVFQCDTSVKMGPLHEFCRDVLRSNSWAESCYAVPKGFVSLKDVPDLSGGRWDVRQGRIHRQTQLQRDSPEEENSSDDDDEMWDDETYNRYGYFLGGDSDDGY
jgi:hypothetical protein